MNIPIGRSSARDPTEAGVRRRLAATAIDYGLVGAAALGVLGVAQLLQVPRLLASPSPLAGQALGFVSLTLPATAALALAESGGGSPGKRLTGLKMMGPSGGHPSYRRSLVRTAAKVALPWEIGHAGVWQAMVGEARPPMLMAFGAAYAVVGLASVQVVRSGRAWYDHLAGTAVRVNSVSHRSIVEKSGAGKDRPPNKEAQKTRTTDE